MRFREGTEVGKTGFKAVGKQKKKTHVASHGLSRGYSSSSQRRELDEAMLGRGWTTVLLW